MRPKADRDTVRITKTVVEALKPDSVRWDSSLPGFGVRRFSGFPSYVLKLGAGRRGKSRWLTIGRHGAPWVDEQGKPCTLTAERARQEAIRLLGEKNRGRDPAAARDRVRRLPTLKEFSERYIDEHAIPHKKPRSVADDRANLSKRILPALGKVRIDQLTTADVSGFHRSRRKTPVNANRCLALLSHMCSMAERWGVRETGSNPCKGVERYREKRRKRYLSEEEIGRLAIALDDAEKENPLAVQAIRLLLFTGARKGEILSLRWSEVDLRRDVIELADAKRGPRPLYLNAPAKKVLASLPKLAGNPYLFPGRRTGQHLTELRLWEDVREKGGIPDVRLHDLRHSFASVLVSGGASLPLIGGLLGHTQPGTTARYTHLSDDPLRQAAERAGEKIEAAMLRKKEAGISADSSAGENAVSHEEVATESGGRAG